jgi:hypothetical protein
MENEEIKEEDFDEDMLPDPDTLTSDFSGGSGFTLNFT